MEELNAKIHTDQREISTLPKIVKTPRSEVNPVDVKIQRAKGKKQFKNTAGKNIKEKDMQSKDKEEEKLQKINPSNQPMNIGTDSENRMSTNPYRGVGRKSVQNSVKGTETIKTKPATSVELRTDDENFTSAKNCTSDSLETLKTHPEHRNSQSVLTQHMKVASSHPVDCHSRHRNIKERDSIGLVSNLTTKKCLKVNVKPLHTEETSKLPLEDREGFPGNLDCNTLKPVQAGTTLQNSLYDSCVNATKPIIPSIAKPKTSTKKALPSNPWPSTDISNSRQARTKKHIAASVLIEESRLESAALPTGSSHTYKATKEKTLASCKPLENLLKDKELTESNKHQQDCHHFGNCDDPQSCLKMRLMTSAEENQSEVSPFKRDYKKCSQLYSIHQHVMEKSKQNLISLPGKIQKADTLDKLVKHKGKEHFEFICQTTEGDPGKASFIETKSEALSNSSKSISPLKTRVSTNEKNKKRVKGMTSKAKTPHTLSAVGENCAAKQKFNKTESSSCSLTSTSHHPPPPSMTTTTSISVDISTTTFPSGHLSQGSGLSHGHQRSRQVLRNVFPPSEDPGYHSSEG